jgi:hypothetical protein
MAGVSVTYEEFKGTFHAFLLFLRLAQTKRALQLSKVALREAFGMAA